MKIRLAWILALAAGLSRAVLAQDAAPPGADLAAFAATRFPQPVRVGDLIGRTVLQPLESRPVLGHVSEVVRLPDGRIDLVMTFGGFLGLFTRVIAVPSDAMVLVGSELEILDYTPQQLQRFATFDSQHSDRSNATPLAPGEFIRMGLAHPSH